MMTVIPSPVTNTVGGVRWRRVLLGALLLESSLLVVTLPISEIFGSPFAFSASSRARDPRIFFAAVPLACLVLGYLVARWVTRPVAAHRLRHALLLGAMATAIYFASIAGRPGGVSVVVAEYGLLWFVIAQSLRIVGCMAGALHPRRR